MHLHIPISSRRGLALPLTAIAVTAFATGCGSDSGDKVSATAKAAPSSTTAASDKRVKLGIVTTLTNVPFAQRTIAGAKDGAAASNATIQAVGPASINPVQAQKQARDLLATGVDGLSVSPFPTEAWPKALKDDQSKLANTITHNTRPPEGSPVKTFVGINDTDAARALAKETIKNAGWDEGTSGTILLAQCVPGKTGVLAERIKGLKETFESAMPKVKVVGPLQANVDPNKNTTDWQNLLKANPNPLAAGGTCDQDGESLYKIKRSTGGKFTVFAFETPPGTLRGLKDGSIVAGVAVNWYLEGWISSKISADAARGKAAPEGWVDAGYTVINKDNIDEITARDASDDATKAWYKPKIDEYLSSGASAVKPLADAAK